MTQDEFKFSRSDMAFLDSVAKILYGSDSTRIQNKGRILKNIIEMKRRKHAKDSSEPKK